MDISIIFATYNRDLILHRTISSFIELNTDGIEYEIIVVDNACNVNTKALVERYEERLPVIYLSEEKPGKNAAINKGLVYSSGQLIIFTDDDIIADQMWMTHLYQASVEFSDVNVFGGSITPAWPKDGDKEFLRVLDLEDGFFKVAYVICTGQDKPVFIEPQKIWGPNMAIRRCVFEEHNLKFNEDIGPNKKSYIMGSETDMLRQLESLGYKALFVPDARVKHQIRTEQLSIEWIKLRARNVGKTMVANDQVVFGRFMFRGVPFYLYKKLAEHSLRLLIHFLFAKLSMYRIRQYIHISKIRGTIEQLHTVNSSKISG